MSDIKDWTFSHDVATDAKWTPGLREIFEYRDLAIKESTKGDYVAHLVRHNGKKTKDEVQKWHVHDCTFQLVYVLNGWAKFEYAGQGVRTIRKGDCINQRPGIPHRELACSEDFEVPRSWRPDFRPGSSKRPTRNTLLNVPHRHPERSRPIRSGGGGVARDLFCRALTRKDPSA